VHRSKRRLQPEFDEIDAKQKASARTHDRSERVSALAPFPWDDAIAAGLGILRLPPAAFWAMTPRELALAMRGAAGISAFTPSLRRGDLADLMRRFPDGCV
jgi:uncharacterized phage protein (TIGR02216 family)